MLHNIASYLSSSNGAIVLVIGTLLVLAFTGRVCIAAGKKDRVDSLLMAFFFIELSVIMILLSFGFE